MRKPTNQIFRLCWAIRPNCRIPPQHVGHLHQSKTGDNFCLIVSLLLSLFEFDYGLEYMNKFRTLKQLKELTNPLWLFTVPNIYSDIEITSNIEASFVNLSVHVSSFVQHDYFLCHGQNRAHLPGRR